MLPLLSRDEMLELRPHVRSAKGRRRLKAASAQVGLIDADRLQIIDVD